MKNFLIVCLAFLFSGEAHSQTAVPPPGGDRTMTDPVPYAFTREADLTWSKRVWRTIYLDEKINLPLKYPLSQQSIERRNLVDVLMDAIREGTLVAFSYVDDEFTMPISYKEILSRGGARVDTVEMPGTEPPYDLVPVAIQKTFSRDKVIGYRLKEDWFFDSRRSVMDVRIIGISPVIYAFDESGNIREGNMEMSLFWVYYPDARRVLANQQVFVRANNIQHLTFDDVFQKRLFESIIYKESNVYDRRISDYQTGLNAVLESERIRNEIADFEHDLWEF